MVSKRHPVGRRAYVLVSALVLLSLLASPTSAVADAPLERLRLAFAERGQQLMVKELQASSFLFDKNSYKKLARNPLATLLVIRLYVYRKGSSKPVGYSLISARIVYDLWLEQYEVRIDRADGRTSGRYEHLYEAYKQITEFRNLPIAALDDVVIGPHHYLALVAELNPVSKATRSEMRRWLTRPAGTASLDRGTSFFGSFVSIFVNAKIPAADRVVRARSQPFYRVPR